MLSKQRRIKLNQIFLCISIFSIGTSAQSGLVSTDQDLSRIGVKNFRGYREITYKGSRILIERFRHNRFGNISFTRDGQNLVFVSQGTATIFKIDKVSGQKTRSLFVKRVSGLPNKVGYLSIISKTQFDSNPSPCFDDVLKNAMKRIVGSDFISGVNETALSNTLDKASCKSLDPSALASFRKEIVKEVVSDSSFLLKCFNEPSMLKEIDERPKLKSLAVEVLGKYLDESERIQSGQSKLKFGCFQAASNKNISAKYEPSDTSIRFAIIDDELAENSCKNRSQLFAHELIHAAGFQDPVPYEFDTLCAKALNLPALGKDSCKEEYRPLVELSKGTEVIQAVMSATDKTEQARVQPVLQAAVKAEDFVPVDAGAVEKLATAPSNSPEFAASLDKVYSSLSANMDAMARPLNSALGAAVSPSYAGTEGTSSGSSTKTGTSRSSSATRNIVSAKNSNEEYTAEEILLDRYGADSGGQKTAQNIARPNSSGAITKKQNQDIGSEGSSNIGAMAATGGNISSGGGSGGLSAEAAASPSRAMPSKASRSIASAGSPRASIAQDLSIYSEIKGSKYQEIKSLYNDSGFRKQLVEKAISIQVGSSLIGAPLDQAATRFVDTGSTLRKVNTGGQ